ncbi:MAG: redoxin domain-containing protein, partial [Planctomycetaceae bacterium]|nr:redoxin domain-containing protein [Planctomycetaceae bacterium]
MGNVGAATELEKVAKENLSSDDPGLASDSRLILIGFALEDLKNGKKEAAETIVNYFQQIKTTNATPDVPTLMIMGMAREDLASGGYDEQAQLVRGMILDFYADSPDPAIAEMAANAAGNVTFEAIEKQRAALTSGAPDAAAQVTVEQWSKSVETLIAESPDLQTAQYLAAAALEFEGLKREDLVKATYDALGDAFTDPSSAINKEVGLAEEARQTRKDVIGKDFDWDLPTTDGKKVPISDFSGKVVLMPFWAEAFPSSLSIVPQLKAICAKHPDQVVIVGVNLDPEGADVQPFINKSQLGFISLRSESSPTKEISNQIAHDFGMVSLPFVAILDKKGVVQDLNFTGQNLEKQVTNLLSQ